MTVAPIGFWGLVVEPGKLYSQVVPASFKITMASVDPVASDDHRHQRESPSRKSSKTVSNTLMLNHGVDGDFALCSLTAGQRDQQALDVVFGKGESIQFYVDGKHAIHLTGYYLDDDDEELDSDLSDAESFDDESVTESEYESEIESDESITESESVMESESDGSVECMHDYSDASLEDREESAMFAESSSSESEMSAMEALDYLEAGSPSDYEEAVESDDSFSSSSSSSSCMSFASEDESEADAVYYYATTDSENDSELDSDAEESEVEYYMSSASESEVEYYMSSASESEVEYYVSSASESDVLSDAESCVSEMICDGCGHACESSDESVYELVNESDLSEVSEVDSEMMQEPAFIHESDIESVEESDYCSSDDEEDEEEEVSVPHYADSEEEYECIPEDSDEEFVIVGEEESDASVEDCDDESVTSIEEQDDQSVTSMEEDDESITSIDTEDDSMIVNESDLSDAQSGDIITFNSDGEMVEYVGDAMVELDSDEEEEDCSYDESDEEFERLLLQEEEEDYSDASDASDDSCCDEDDCECESVCQACCHYDDVDAESVASVDAAEVVPDLVASNKRSAEQEEQSTVTEAEPSPKKIRLDKENQQQEHESEAATEAIITPAPSAGPSSPAKEQSTAIQVQDVKLGSRNSLVADESNIVHLQYRVVGDESAEEAFAVADKSKSWKKLNMPMDFVEGDNGYNEEFVNAIRGMKTGGQRLITGPVAQLSGTKRPILKIPNPKAKTVSVAVKILDVTSKSA